MVKCNVPWCEREAEYVWERTAEELKAMRGPKRKGGRAEAMPVRSVCYSHMPWWRMESYVHVGELRKAA